MAKQKKARTQKRVGTVGTIGTFFIYKVNSLFFVPTLFQLFQLCSNCSKLFVPTVKIKVGTKRQKLEQIKKVGTK